MGFVAGGGFMVQVHSPAAKAVSEASLALIAEGDRVALYEAMRQQLLPIPALSEFTIAVPQFVPTVVVFRSLATAALAMLGRTPANQSVPNFVGAAFIFAGRNKTEEDEEIRRARGGRDSLGKPYPIPALVYDKIISEPARPLLTMTLWDVQTANDPSLLAIAHAIAGLILETCIE
jgi:hypothetical protein